MSGLFGPQTANAVTQKPSSYQVQRYGGVQTWFKDCSGPGASDGTVPDAAFYNRIIGALDYICGAAGVSGIAGDDSILYRAILQMVSQDAPDALNSLRELAQAIQDDPNFAGTVMSMLANRLRFDQAQFLNATQKAQAVSNLGLSTVAVSGNYADLAGKPTLGTAAALDVGTGANQVVQLTAAGKYPAVDGSLITGFATVARSGAYSDLSGKPTLGTSAALDVGTTANKVVQLTAAGKYPAVDGSLITGVNASLSSGGVALSADTPLGAAGTYTDLLTLTLGAGTYFIQGRASMKSTSSSSPMTVRLTDGTTVFDGCLVNTSVAGGRSAFPVSAIVTGPITVKLQGADLATADGLAVFNDSGSLKDTRLTYVKIAA